MLIGRQPIFNRRLEVSAYELVYRGFDQQANLAESSQAQPASISSPPPAQPGLLDSFNKLNLEDLVEDQRAFIKLNPELLGTSLPASFSPTKVILETPDSLQSQEMTLPILQQVASQGYQIALDDVAAYDRIAPYLPITSYVKVNLLRVDWARLAELVARLRFTRAKLIAKQVETQPELEYCQRLGFDYFQGYFVCRPNLIAGRRMSPSRLVMLQLLARVTDPQVDFGALQDIVAQDIHLTYRLLRLANSAYYARSATVKSIREAMMLIGLNSLRSWMVLLLMTTVENKPPVLMGVAIQRAKMCERLGRLMGETQVEPFFLVGLLSILDAVMDLPIKDAIAGLPLAPEIAAALATRQGWMGLALQIATAYERGDWEVILRSGLQPAEVQAVYMEAVRWSSQLARDLKNNTL